MFKPTKTLALTMALATGVLLAGCGTTPTATTSANASATSAATPPAVTGTANVAYAGSLQLVNDQYLSPAFKQATGLAFQGRGGGSFGVAHLIATKEIQPNVFESIGSAPIKELSPQFTDWAVGFASSPLVIAYSPKSPYASQLNAIAKGQTPLKELFTLMQKPDFHLGRTNPNTDPQGQVFVMMLHLAQQQLNLPSGTADAILGGQNNPKQIFAEESILSQLQAGQLDASSAYLPEAIQRKLDYIVLPDSMNFGNPADSATYATQHLTLKGGKTATGSTAEIYLTTIKGSKDQQAGEKFVSYLLSPAGQAIYKAQGYQLTPAKIWGNRAAVPSAILQLVQGS
ncbi:MAG: extracellular solute-binding protein [Peptococcaceae bacterium]|nr:extracellular solute-binding protein [Peptococcaceae bacterium]